MKNEGISISIILPTLNEVENIRLLIPEIIQVLEFHNIDDFEIIVVDDNSSDGTEEFINSINKKNDNIKILVRKDKKSLPKAIYEGILYSSKTFVMWLDADGSMDSESVEKLILMQIKNQDSVIVGSRFVPGGGYKGLEEERKQGIFEYLRKISNSEDSVLAIYLSKYFNKLISSITNIGVNDITSGFIVGQKKYFTDDVFSEATYGEYFLYLLKNLKKKKVKVIEVGYFCKPRKYGVSKTSTNYFVLLKLSLPYIKAALSRPK
tara:strand:- start:2450 stop:3241 length:792 start_codon:yes stop_codon:yes gene_type:complete